MKTKQKTKIKNITKPIQIGGKNLLAEKEIKFAMLDEVWPYPIIKTK